MLRGKLPTRQPTDGPTSRKTTRSANQYWATSYALPRGKPKHTVPDLLLTLAY